MNSDYIKSVSVRKCSVDGCERPYRAKGFCGAHYMKNHTYGSPYVGKTSQTPKNSRLKYAKVAALYEGDDCLIWPFKRLKNGYGQIRINQKQFIASRFICELAHGAPPESKMQAAHSCGNGHLGCVNPRHLRWATAKENAQDCVAHGTKRIGETHGNAKLSDADVIYIRSVHGAKTQAELAAHFGVHYKTISDIQRRKIWRHI